MLPLVAIALCASLTAPNPVLPHVGDAGVLRYGGHYYLMGVGTAGALYTSNDLVNWTGPQHAFSMSNRWAEGPAAADSEIHACDLVLSGGRFHLYWSVNHGQLRQIGHALASVPDGPYRETSVDAPFDGRIDPQCFIDEDGRHYFFTVKFPGGNIIYGQAMDGPQQLAERPHRLLFPLRNTWEAMDFTPEGFPLLINEGPFVVRHQDRYYMIYNANHTDPTFGNYALGVAEAKTPLGFDNRGKYPLFVLRSNRDAKHEGIAVPAAEREVNCAGQPNLVRGPNGLEWWLVYFADFPARSQAIDRVHFLGREMYIEGPSREGDAGYQPVPVRPSFIDRFDNAGIPGAGWLGADSWNCAEGMLHSKSRTGGRLEADLETGGEWVCEIGLDFAPDAAGAAGVEILLHGAAIKGIADLERRQWRWESGSPQNLRRTAELSEALTAPGRHTLRVMANHERLSACLDGVRMPDFVLGDKQVQAGRVALSVKGSGFAFDSFSLTRGWEEYGERIAGWHTAEGNALPAHADGLHMAPGARAFKGTPLPQYELSLQAMPGEPAVYPVWVDEANWLRAEVDSAFAQAAITGMLSGVAIEERRFTIPRRIHRAHTADENGNHLRFVKLADRVVFFAEGAEIGSVSGAWPASRCALEAGEEAARFDYITRYELPLP